MKNELQSNIELPLEHKERKLPSIMVSPAEESESKNKKHVKFVTDSSNSQTNRKKIEISKDTKIEKSSKKMVKRGSSLTNIKNQESLKSKVVKREKQKAQQPSTRRSSIPEDKSKKTVKRKQAISLPSTDKNTKQKIKDNETEVLKKVPDFLVSEISEVLKSPPKIITRSHSSENLLNLKYLKCPLFCN